MIELRGSHIGMVPQDPMSNLNPVWKIGYQVRETLKANGRPDGPDDVAGCLLKPASRTLPGVPSSIRTSSPAACVNAPDRHRPELQPKLLIADEPTSRWT